MANRMSIGEVSNRSGVSVSALRFYEQHGLVRSERNEAGHRRYPPDTLRRLAFIRVAQKVGLRLDEVSAALAALPEGRTPTRRDWERLARRWGPRLDEQIAVLDRLRSQLTQCIGCGCLSLRSCALSNPHDAAAARGSGPRYLLGDRPGEVPATSADGSAAVGVRASP